MTEPSHQLKRSLSFFAVCCLGINGVIGQGIFLVPSKAAAQMGPAAVLGLLIGGALCFCLALCFAEVGSRIQGTGGAYLYARAAFGEFVGFEVGWMTCCVAVIAWATLSNGFTKVMATFFPVFADAGPQKILAVAVVTILTLVNLLGADVGARVVKFFTVAKLSSMLVFVCVGVFFIDLSLFEPFAPKGFGPLADTTLMLLYAYVGFEIMVVPAGEMKNPQRTVPLALFIVIAVSAALYLSIYCVATGTLPSLAEAENPVASAAQQFMGPWGTTLISVGIALSVFGTNAGSALVSPRRFFALAERGDLPPRLATISATTGAPTYAILLTWFLAVALTMSGSFEQLLVLGVVARFGQYIPTTLAVLVLRRKADYDPHAGYRIPGGPFVPVVTLALCAWLLFHSDAQKLMWGGAALALGAVLYALKRKAGWHTNVMASEA